MTKPVRLLALPLLLLSVSCATKVGHWPATEFSYPTKREALQGEVRSSLEKQGWLAMPGDTASDVHGIKPGPGGHRTVADFHFVDTEKGSSFDLTAGSHHVVNWLTFGILGRSTQARARNVIRAWLEEWNKGHPK